MDDNTSNARSLHGLKAVVSSGKVMNTQDDDEQPGQKPGQKFTMGDIANNMIDRYIINRFYYDKLISSNNEFVQIVSEYMKSIKVFATSVVIPADYVKIELEDDAELGQIAAMEGLVIFIVKSGTDQGTSTFYAVDGIKKVAYSFTGGHPK